MMFQTDIDFPYVAKAKVLAELIEIGGTDDEEVRWTCTR
jgi:hypothetical protein